MKVGVIGGGNMGFAYVQSILNAGLTDEVLVVETNEDRRSVISETKGVIVESEVTSSIKNLDVVILAVKPQIFSQIASGWSDFFNEDQVVISIMAGISIAQMANSLGVNKVVRAMPNTPCQLGAGVTGFFAQNISKEEQAIIKSIFATNGLSVEVEKEENLNEVTALSGSGPAYFFTILKHMVDAGVEMGVEEHQAKALVLGTMKGAFELVNSSDKTLDEFIAAVKSKGGTTEAALNSFADSGLDVTIKNGLKAARDRSIELSKLN